MAHPAFRWSRLLVITALLVITTGVAAAPFRDAWLPIVGRPLNLWNNGAIKMPPTAAPLLVSRDLVTPQRMVDAPFIVAPDRLDYRVSRAGSSNSGRDDSSPAYSSSWSSQTASRNAGRRSRAYSGNGWGGGSGGGSGRFSDTSFARRSGSYNRDNSPTNAGSRSSGSSSATGSASNGGGGGGNRGPSGGNGGADDLFTDHGKGLPDLSGSADSLLGNGGVAGGKNGPRLASSPEPSSILLFGTGIVAVAGALRRRMRR
jgi:hypothetical protein